MVGRFWPSVPIQENVIKAFVISTTIGGICCDDGQRRHRLGFFVPDKVWHGRIIGATIQTFASPSREEAAPAGAGAGQVQGPAVAKVTADERKPSGQSSCDRKWGRTGVSMVCDYSVARVPSWRQRAGFA